MQNFKYLTLILLITLISCSKEDVNTKISNNNHEPWLVDINDIIHFGTEKDKIKSIDKPEFVELQNSHLHEEDIVLAYMYKDVVHVYPMDIMEAHEIVNDSIDDNYFAITHCPLTNSSIAWNRKIQGEVHSFGISGMLYKENLIPYDRETASHWSQMLSICINGEQMGENALSSFLVRTKFLTIMQSFPDALVLNHENCDSNSCDIGIKSTKDEPVDGNTNDNVIDSVRYFGVVKGKTATLLPLTNITDNVSISNFIISQKQHIRVASKNYDVHLVFESEGKSFTPIQDSLPIIMKDDEGNYYNIFGVVISGDNLGYRLNSQNSFYAHTFAWKNIYKRIIVLDE